MRAYDIILKKRKGNKLTKEEIAFFVNSYTKGGIPDYQASVLLMTIYFKGMDDEETANLTEAMMNSGDVYDLSSISGKKIDKHSTGGVGDKVSIILAPLVASAGVVVPMMSGRGLGHTGGTLDKLESIPGFRTNLTKDEFISNLKKINVAMIGQSELIAPADKKLYALRDVTGTIESIPLIASSIMSKKLAEGIDGLVLDVKTGSGAFMKKERDAVRLAKNMAAIGKKTGKKVVALITDMDQPLGNAIGNSLEIKECIEVLKGRGPQDLIDITLELGAYMLKLAGKVNNVAKGKDILKRHLSDGSAYQRFRDMVELQGGDVRAIDNPSLLPSAKFSKELLSERTGYILKMDTEAIGIASCILGAGRERIEDKIDPAVGIVIDKKNGDKVKIGERLALLHYNAEDRLAETYKKLQGAYLISSKRPKKRQLIRRIIMA
ncbi:MAG: thymidine phosphorylase [Nitrospirota bacterium]